MITYLINEVTKQRIEVLDDMAQFQEGTIMAIPHWSKEKMVVSEVVLLTKTEGDANVGLRCSVTQNVFVKAYEKK